MHGTIRLVAYLSRAKHTYTHCVAWTGVRKDSADCVRQLGGAGLLHAHHTAAISTETPEHLTIELHRGTS